jgi:hypothetical protein
MKGLKFDFERSAGEVGGLPSIQSQKTLPKAPGLTG